MTPVKIFHSRPRDEIVERIECLMIEQQLKPGDRLPGERELCEAWNCNRMTFRAAVKRLIAEGRLVNVPSVGNFVAPARLERYLQDLTSFSDFVMLQGRKIENRLVSQGLLPAAARIAEKLQVKEGSDIFQLVRLRIVDETPVSLESVMLPCQRFPGIHRYNFERLSLYGVLERKYGVIFCSGEEEISLTYADANEAELLGVQEGEALFYLKGLTWDEQHNPIELIKSVSRVDQIRFAGILQ